MKFSDFLQDQKIYQNGYQVLQPAASVVMPTYARNKEGWLTSCIESVLGQTFKNLEFIIVDDGSSDGSEAVIKSFASRDPRIVYVRHETNSGLHAIRMNEAIMMARGPYVGFMFDDNLWFPDTLQVMVDTLQSSGADFVHGFVEMPRPTGKIIFGTMPTTLELLKVINPIPNGAVMCSRSFFDKVGLYDPHILMRRLCDWDLWLRALRHNLKCKAINQVIGVERGNISPSSLGNTILLDYKVALSYILDSDRNGERSAALHPERILDYDVFDPEKLMPFVRGLTEWEKLAASIYDPFFEKHPTYNFEPPLRNNRWFDRGLNGYRINPYLPVFKQRKRILVLANRISRVVQDLMDANAYDPDRIVIASTEWSWELFSPEEIDQLILIDCEMADLMPFLEDCHHQDVSIVYFVVHGMDDPYWGDRDPLAGLDLTKNKGIIDLFKGLLYFGLPGVPWFYSHQDSVRAILEASDHLVVLNDPEKSHLIDGLSPLKLEFIPNQVPEQEMLETAPFDLVLYLADCEQLEEASLQAVEELISSSLPGAKWSAYLLPGKSLPERLHKFPDRLEVIETLETLPSLVALTRHAFWAVPREILERYSGYHRLLIEEDLARNNSWISVVDAPELSEPLTYEKLQNGSRDLKNKVRESANGYRADARFLQILNITQGVALRKKIASLAQKPRARSVKSLALLNSQALAGSEVYGLLVTEALTRIGFDIQAATHASIELYPPGIKNINDWLAAHHLRPIIKAEYSKVSRSIANPVISESDLQEYSNRLRDWLDAQGIDLVFSSGFISEPLVGWSAKRLFFMALFAPWDSFVKRMVYLRYRLNGLVTDTIWATNLWKRWMPPPVSCVPSLVERDYFTIRNSHLPPEPVCIAVAGTLQPRKRQLEALAAIRNLVREGYDLRLNLYGYEMISFDDYIDRVREMASDPILKQRVIFHGFVDDPMEIPRDNHIVLIPSTDESLPQGLIFNQASGLIAVACPAGGIEEAIQDGVTGFLAKGFSIEDCTVALRNALDHRSEWPAISDQARQAILDRCSEQIFTNSLLAMMMQGTDIHLSEGRRFFYKPSSRRQSVGRPGDREASSNRRRNIAVYNIDISSLVIGPEINRAPLLYPLVSDQDKLIGFHFRVGTFFTHPKGCLKLAVRGNADAHLLREATLDISPLNDNQWVKVNFDPIQNSSGQRYTVAISAEVDNGRLAIYESLPTKNKKLQEIILKGFRGLRQVVKLPMVRYLPTLYPIYKED